MTPPPNQAILYTRKATAAEHKHNNNNMKTFFITAALAASCALAQTTTPAAPVTPATPTTPAASSDPATLSPEAQKLVPFIDEMAADLESANDLLETVKDKASADAAAPKLIQIFDKLKQNDEKMEALAGNNEAIRKELEPLAKQKLEAPLMRFVQVLMKIGMSNGYESEALKKVFEDLQPQTGM